MEKNKLLLVTIIILTTISGCNLPEAEVNPDILASQVSELLTNTPNITDSIDSPAPLIPTITIEIVQETINPTVTDTPSPTIETTLTPSLVPVGIPTGSPAWIDTFENGTRFGINPEGYDDGQTIINVSGGTLIMKSVSAMGWRGWRLTSQKPGNYYLEAAFQTLDCAGSDQYGLVVQSPDFESGYGYYFGLTCDGRYAFQKWEESGLTNLQGWVNDQNIQSGSGKNNKIGILKSGNQYNLYINSVSIVQVEDESFSSPGYFGPFIAGVNTPNFSYQLEEISYWILP